MIATVYGFLFVCYEPCMCGLCMSINTFVRYFKVVCFAIACFEWKSHTQCTDVFDVRYE